MKNLRYIFLALILMQGALAYAKSSVPNVSKRFKNVPLSEVVSTLEKKTKFTIEYNPEDVDGSKLINTSFKQTRLTTVIKKLFGKDYTVKVKSKTKTVIITKKEVPAPTPSPQPSVAPQKEPDLNTEGVVTMAASEEQRQQNIDSIRRTTTLNTVSRLDSVMKITPRKVKQPAAEQPMPKYARCSHRLIAGVGAGYGEVLKHGHAAAQGDLNYAFFFTENWGVSVGLGLDYYRSLHKYSNAYDKVDYTDTDEEPEAVFRVREENMKLYHTLFVVDLPIMLQMEYPVKNVFLYGSVGARFGFPILHSTSLTGDQIQTGYYAKWDLTLEDMHEYGTTPISERGTFPVKTLTIAPQAEFGVAIPVREDLAVGIGAYGNVSVWNEKDVLPWQVGAKVSLRWSKPAKTKPLPTVYETITVQDTTWTVREIIDTIRTVRYDTIMHPAEAIAKVMEMSIIWFDLDKTIPKLDPPDMLDEIAAILVANPEQRIEVNGHTCDLGSKTYNEDLSMRRAQAVVDLLVQKGVRPDQMVVHAYANSKPYYSKSHDRILDRRVEIKPIIVE